MILTMSESVSTEDSHDSVARTNSTRGQFESLKNLKREMEFRNSELGKTWSELSRIMYQYQSELIQKHDELDSSLAPGERARISHLESVIDNSKTNVSKLEKRISELEYKLLEKDSEIVRLRTEVHQLKNEVTMKDNLIQKLQNQMANEAMEYQNEIVSLKELLQVESITSLVAESRESAPLGAKRRKAAQTGRASPHYTTSEESSYTVKTEQASHNPPVFPSPQPVSSNGQPMDEEEAENLHASTSETREAEFPESSSPEENNAELEVEGDGQGENRLLMDDVYGATGQQSQIISMYKELMRPTRTRRFYSIERRRDIGVYAALHGTSAASRYFTKLLGHNVPISTVSDFKRLYATPRADAASHKKT